MENKLSPEQASKLTLNVDSNKSREIRFGPHDEPAGKLWVQDGKLFFEGDADESAKLFIKLVKKYFEVSE